MDGFFRATDLPDFSAANCQGVNTDLFYPADGEGTPNELRIIRRICAACPIQPECLDWALKHEVHGIWGGMSPKQRRAVRRQRGIRLNAY